MDFDAMNAPPPSGLVLAKWHCDKVLWRQYRDSEGFDAAVRSAILLILVPVIVTSILLAATLIAYGFAYLSSFWSFWTVVVVLTLGGILALTGLILLPFRYQKAAAMRTETGEVILDLDGFALNNDRFDWTFGSREIQYSGRVVWRFQNCRRKSITGKNGTSFEVLEFECEATTRKLHGTGGAENTIIIQRLPIPPDKISQADAIASRLNLCYSPRISQDVSPTGI